MGVLLDSSALTSALIIARSLSGRVVGAGLEGRFRPLVPALILDEVARSLREKASLRRRFAYSRENIEEYVADPARAAELVVGVPDIPPTCRDPDDDHVLAAASAGAADRTVAGDKDLLDLGSFRGTPIVTVRAFADELSFDATTPGA